MMKKAIIYLCISVIVLVMNWEYQRGLAASIMPTQAINDRTGIPEESIRLRVLAHSDSPRDQWLKREIRDVVVEQMTEWLERTESVEEARQHIEATADEMQEIVQQAMRERGFSYAVQVEFGSIVFPSKLYGGQYYPAGEYEGLLVTIGAGQGENWWCVLFPPLCFIDFGTGEVLDPDREEKDRVQLEGEETSVEVRFFVAELFQKVKGWL